MIETVSGTEQPHEEAWHLQAYFHTGGYVNVHCRGRPEWEQDETGRFTSLAWEPLYDTITTYDQGDDVGGYLNVEMIGQLRRRPLGGRAAKRTPPKRCAAKNKKGEPCGGCAVKPPGDARFCVSHQPKPVKRSDKDRLEDIQLIVNGDFKVVASDYGSVEVAETIRESILNAPPLSTVDEHRLRGRVDQILSNDQDRFLAVGELCDGLSESASWESVGRWIIENVPEDAW